MTEELLEIMSTLNVALISDNVSYYIYVDVLAEECSSFAHMIGIVLLM